MIKERETKYIRRVLSTITTMFSLSEKIATASGDWSHLLHDKVVFITGAGGGIGSAISLTCALHGARVAVSDVDKAAADNVAATIIGSKDGEVEKTDRVISLELDTVDEQAIQKAVKMVVDKWGTIDVLVNTYVQ
jgi:NAD(P)-dependent dehydrogenase (short-subunit alcohol dehydrogenase family)